MDKNFVASVCERDIDLLMLEELTVSTGFCEWLLEQVLSEVHFSQRVGVWHSVSEGVLGETDLLFVFSDRTNKTHAFLIENKIDAPPQPDQAERYKLRGQKGSENGDWDGFTTVIIAPERYLNNSRNSIGYHVLLSYEAIESYFLRQTVDPARSQYKANMLREGIEQNRRGYQPEIDKEMTEFVREYYKFATDNFPTLELAELAPRPKGSTWILIKPSSLPGGIHLNHQMNHGKVKLFFDPSKFTLERVSAAFFEELPKDAVVEMSGKSPSISVPVPKLDVSKRNFGLSIDDVKNALQRATVLKDIAIQVESTLAHHKE